MTPKKKKDAPPGKRVPDDALVRLFDEFGGRLISPGGAASMLGVSRQRLYELIDLGRLRCFRTDDVRAKWGPFTLNEGPKWAYIPLDDIEHLAAELGRDLRPPR